MQYNQYSDNSLSTLRSIQSMHAQQQQQYDASKRLLKERIGQVCFDQVCWMNDENKVRFVRVAVVDTGFDRNNFFLAPSLTDGISYSSCDGNRITRSKIVAESPVRSAIGPTLSDHGTHVAGITNIVADSDYVRIVPIKIGQKGCNISASECDYACSNNNPLINTIQAFRDLAIRRDIYVVNVSWSFPFDNSVLRNALIELAQSGKLIVFAAGNYNQVLSSDLVSLANDPNMKGRMIIVGATEKTLFGESLAGFSNYPGYSVNAQDVFITAPGTDITSTAPCLTGTTCTNMQSMNGTSMAAPVISGILAKALSSYPLLTIDQVKYLLFATARKYRRNVYGSGSLNAELFMQNAREMHRKKVAVISQVCSVRTQSIRPYNYYSYEHGTDIAYNQSPRSWDN